MSSMSFYTYDRSHSAACLVCGTSETVWRLCRHLLFLCGHSVNSNCWCQFCGTSLQAYMSLTCSICFCNSFLTTDSRSLLVWESQNGLHLNHNTKSMSRDEERQQLEPQRETRAGIATVTKQLRATALARLWPCKDTVCCFRAITFCVAGLQYCYWTRVQQMSVTCPSGILIQITSLIVCKAMYGVAA